MTALTATGWLLAAAGLAAAAIAVARGRRLRVLAAQTSHEVRGPLTAAALALDGMTRRGELDAPRALPLALQLKRAGRALEDLTPGGGVENRELVVLANLVAELETAWRPVAVACGRALHVAAAGVDPVVRADGARLAQAVGNLIANALEHGQGTVRLTVGEDAAGAFIAVADEGGGPDRPLHRLVAPSRRARARGHGVRVAAQVANGAGGCLTLTRSEFALRLPAARVPA